LALCPIHEHLEHFTFARSFGGWLSTSSNFFSASFSLHDASVIAGLRASCFSLIYSFIFDARFWVSISDYLVDFG
jgi:hypothetical protein